MIPDRKYYTLVDFYVGFHSMNLINPKKAKPSSSWVMKNFWIYASTCATLPAFWHTKFFNTSYQIGFENDRAGDFLERAGAINK